TIRGEAGVLVEAVVDDLPVEPLRELEGERSPEGSLHDDGDFVKLVLLARPGEAFQHALEGVSLEPSGGRVLAADPGQRQKSDAGSRAGVLLRLARARESSIEHALAPPRQGLR